MTLERRAKRFVGTVLNCAVSQIQVVDEKELVWFLRHAFRMGWNAAKQDSYTAKRKQEAQRAGAGGK